MHLFNQHLSNLTVVSTSKEVRKGFSNQIQIVVAVVMAMVFVLLYWSATSGSMQQAFDSIFNMATGFGGSP